MESSANDSQRYIISGAFRAAEQLSSGSIFLARIAAEEEDFAVNVTFSCCRMGLYIL